MDGVGPGEGGEGVACEVEVGEGRCEDEAGGEGRELVVPIGSSASISESKVARLTKHPPSSVPSS